MDNQWFLKNVPVGQIKLSAAANELGVTATQLTGWVKAGLIKATIYHVSETTDREYRCICPSELNRFRMTYFFKERQRKYRERQQRRAVRLSTERDYEMHQKYKDENFSRCTEPVTPRGYANAVQN